MIESTEQSAMLSVFITWAMLNKNVTFHEWTGGKPRGLAVDELGLCAPSLFNGPADKTQTTRLGRNLRKSEGLA